MAELEGGRPTVSHDYDPRIVFHSFAANVPHLQTWIDELINLTEHALPSNTTPNTDVLVQSLQRHDAVFKELLRQTRIFSEPITRMLSQVWSGVLQLMVYMIKSYHRYVKQTSHLQIQAQSLLSERQRSEAANKVQREEFELERTALRAQIRNIGETPLFLRSFKNRFILFFVDSETDSENESLRQSQKFMTQENNRLRRIIDVYIRSADFNDPVWDVMKPEDASSSTTRTTLGVPPDSSSSVAPTIDTTKATGVDNKGKAVKTAATSGVHGEKEYGFKRKEAIDAGKMQLKTLNRLDIEINEILANVLKEENRQRLLMKDVMKLVGSNSDLFLTAMDSDEDEASDVDEQTASLLGVTSAEAAVHAEPPVSNEVQRSPDRRKTVQPSPGSLPRKSSVATTSPSTKHVEIVARHSVKSLKKMSTFHHRSSVHVGNNVLGGAATSVVECLDQAVQVDMKDDYVLALDDPEDHVTLDLTILGVAPLAPMNKFVPGLDVPFMIRRRMSSFPKVLRVPPVAWACQLIMSIYLDKIQDDDERRAQGLRPKLMPEHLYDYFLKIMGVQAAADVQISQFLKTCDYHDIKQPRVVLFSKQIGMAHKEDPPSLDVRDTEFILQVLRTLLSHEELLSESQRLGKRKNLAHLGAFVRPDISRSVAMTTVQTLFERWWPEGVEDYVIKVKSLSQSELGPRYVDVDAFLELIMEPWSAVRSAWEEHARYLFKEHCGVYQVLQEASFANDEGVLCSDTVLSEIHRSTAADCFRRPLRLFQDGLSVEEVEHMDAAKGVKNKKGKQGNASKEPVCEMMNRQKFVDVLQIINPALETREIERMFEEALEISYTAVLRTLELLWVRHIDEAANYIVQSVDQSVAASAALSLDSPQGGPTTTTVGESSLYTAPVTTSYDILSVLFDSREGLEGMVPKINRLLGTNREFFVNTRTKISQWTRPYHPRIFRSQDIEMDIFVQVLIRNDVFARCPFVDHLHVSPKDFWPNASVYYRDLLDKKSRLSLDTDRLVIVHGQESSPSGSSVPSMGHPHHVRYLD